MKGGVPMGSLQFTDLQSRPTEFLDCTSVTLDEFQLLVPPFEAAFHAHMAAWRLDGKPRTARQFSVYQNCPLPTPEDRLFFILSTWTKVLPQFTLLENQSYISSQTVGESLRPQHTVVGMTHTPKTVTNNTL